MRLSASALLKVVREALWRLAEKLGSRACRGKLARRAGGGASAAARGAAEMRLFSGTLLAAETPKAYVLKDEAVHLDMQKESEYRRASGALAERQALEAERARLLAEGFPEEGVDAHLRLVSDCPELGYDIASVGPGGRKRHIEVKNISDCNRFFLSDNEWRASRALPNYWFYLVDSEGKGGPVIEMLRASELDPGQLYPCQYRVKFSRKGHTRDTAEDTAEEGEGVDKRFAKTYTTRL